MVFLVSFFVSRAAFSITVFYIVDKMNTCDVCVIGFITVTIAAIGIVVIIVIVIIVVVIVTKSVVVRHCKRVRRFVPFRLRGKIC